MKNYSITAAIVPGTAKLTNRMMRLKKNILKDKILLIMITPALLYFIIFRYLPMYGVLMAFENFSPAKGILGSQWVGLKYFTEFFHSVFAFRLIKNVVLLNFYGILWGFPIPIIFALMLNELKSGAFKRVVQTVSYMPYFISVVVIAGMVFTFLSPNDGVVNYVIHSLGYAKINFMSEPGWFRTIYIGTGIWQGFGYNSIIYLAALAAIDVSMYEAAKIDGASRWNQLVYITLPSLLPTIIILLILQVGRMMDVGFEKVILLYTPSTYNVSDVLSSYVYRIGLLGGEFSFGAAIDLFNSVVNFILLIFINRLSRRLTDVALW